MNRKQSHDPMGSYSNSYNQKNQYQPSPYIELLEASKDARKKGFAYRYDTKNIRSYTNYVKASPASISSIFAQGPKPFKSVSTDKVKVNRSNNDKKKRTRTEQAEQKMHESMCVYPSIPQKTQENPVSKSLYYGDSKLGSEFHPNTYFQQLSGQKNKRKRHLSQNKHNYSDSNHNNNTQSIGILENLQISDIDSLINLIDNCVSEANQYIAFLSEKLQGMKEQLIQSKAQNFQLQHQLHTKDTLISQKQLQITQLQRQINKSLNEPKQARRENGFEVKNLLQIIQKISEQNQCLRNQIQQLKEGRIRKTHEGQKQAQKLKQKDIRSDYFKQIHSKIDILNISIDNNHTFNQGNSPSQDKQRRDKDIAKKYKFIKPKGR